MEIVEILYHLIKSVNFNIITSTSLLESFFFYFTVFS
jgi:hypothetical protein